MTAVLSIISVILGGIPKLVELLRSGKDPADIKLAEFISTDALEVLKEAREEAQDYIDGNG